MGIVLSYACTVVGICISLFYTPVLIRSLGQSEYGIMKIANSVMVYLQIITVGIDGCVLRFVSRAISGNDKDEENRVISIFVMLYVAMSVIILIIGTVVLCTFDRAFAKGLTAHEIYKTKIILLISLASIIVSLPLGVYSGVITAHERFVPSKIILLVSKVLDPVFTLPLLLIGFKSIGATCAAAMVGIIRSLAYYIYCKKKLRTKFVIVKPDKEIIREMSVFSIYVFITAIADKILWSTDQLILGALCSSASVAVYGVGNTIAYFQIMFSTAISGVYAPKVIKMIDNGCKISEISNLFVKIARSQLMVLSLLVCGIVVFGRQFISLWAGDGYDNAYYVAIITMIPMLVPISQNIMISVLQAMNMQKFRSLMYLASALFNLGISIPLAIKYKEIGCVAASAVALIAFNIIIMNVYYARVIHVDIGRYWKELIKITAPIAVLTIASYFIVSKANIGSWISLGIGAIVFTALYLGILWVFCMSKDEKNQIKHVVFRRK